MITRFKLFEMNEGTPEVGDYVICFPIYTKWPKKQLFHIRNYKKTDNFLISHIGELVYKRKGTRSKNLSGEWIDNSKKWECVIKYNEDTTYADDGNFIDWRGLSAENTKQFYYIDDVKEIQYWSKNREELEEIVNANKFGI